MQETKPKKENEEATQEFFMNHGKAFQTRNLETVVDDFDESGFIVVNHKFSKAKSNSKRFSSKYSIFSTMDIKSWHFLL